MIARAALTLLLTLALAAPAVASAQRPSLARLEHEVMCPTCKTLLELSHAPVADRMRAFIRARIAAGDSEGEIKRKLVAEFGEGVLAAPPAAGFGLLAWVLPLVGLLGAGALVAVVARRWTRTERAEAATTPASPPRRLRADAALERRLDEELSRFDY